MDAFSALTLGSVATFVWWGGALWAVPSTQSHVGRFAGSYLLVLPAAALALVLSHAWSAGHLTATVGAVWALKMVVTSLLFMVLAPGTARRYAPRSSVARADSASTTASPAEDPSFEAARTGTPAATLTLRDGAAHPARVTVPTGATVEIANADSILHTAELVRGAHALANFPLPPHQSSFIGPFPDGETELRCAHHPAELAVIVGSAPPEVLSP